MGLGANAPNAPSYDPMLQASLQTYNSDRDAMSMFYNDLAPGQLQYGNQLTAASGQVGQDMLSSMQEAKNWGREQFNTIWPYAKDYLSSQQSLSTLAGENASEAILASREQRARAEDIYRRYNAEFAPAEDAFAQYARGYNSPERAAQASGAAQADVATAFAQQDAARKQAMRSHGLDPSQAAYQGADAINAVAQSAAQAGAGTGARRQSELTGIQLLQQAAAMGQQLTTQELNRLSAASQGANSALQAGQAGAGGINAATSALTAGVGAGGSPVAYGYMSNPYTTLSGQQLGLANSLYGQGTSVLGQQANVIGQATDAQKAGFAGQMQEFGAEQKSEQDAWSGLFKGAGMLGSAFMTPMSGFQGSLGMSALSGLFSDRRLKEDIKPIGNFGKLPMYSFRYKGNPVVQVGYMADEVEQVNPSAVVVDPSGYKRVNYALATASALGG
jgi:hypothetical protein